MVFRTVVDIPPLAFSIAPCEEMLFVGSCFADSIGRRFQEENFQVVVNPYGVMYNPASIMHTVNRFLHESGRISPKVVVFTLGTNHVYVLKETGEIVDNCLKRPQKLFDERILSVQECCEYLTKAVGLLKDAIPEVKVMVTVSPIRYAKYGFHGSAISKATLLLAAEQLKKEWQGVVDYFPAYEIVNDELRDYRFYQPDMIHPSPQTIEYVWERMVESCLSDEARDFLKEWKPIKEALAHRPFHPDSEEYKAFLGKTMEKMELLRAKYPQMPLR
ncbi:MAG: GSCFA domain-containing protein [Prevotella sp.]|nr:GSCFA domain-containing protein [Prevotella sp.]